MKNADLQPPILFTKIQKVFQGEEKRDVLAKKQETNFFGGK
jgi:hypothetical protein